MCTVRCSGHLLEGGSLPRGVCPGDVCPGVSAWGMSAQGVFAQGGLSWGVSAWGSAGVVGECLPGEVSAQGVYPGGVSIFVNVSLAISVVIWLMSKTSKILLICQ